MTRVSLAVAGLGTIAQTIHLPLLERLSDRFTLTALADASPSLADRTGARYGVPAERRFTGVEEMLRAGGFDAVLLLTSGSHAPAAADALRRGYAVLAEKPLGYALAETDELAALGEELTSRLMVGYMKQYDPAARRLAALVEEAGGASAIHHIDITVLHPSSAAQLAFARLRPPANDIPAGVLAELRAAGDKPLRAALGEDADPRVRELYGIIMNSVCHELSLIRLLCGPPATVDNAVLWPARDAGPGDAPSVELSGALAGGGRYGIRWLYQPDYPAYRETVSVHHARGSAELVFPAPYLLNAPTRLTATSGREERVTRTDFTSPVGGFEAELLAFHRLVTQGTPPLSGVRDAAADLVFAQAAVRRLAAANGLHLAGESAHE
ncbi:Gfo/Idh/MocA family oxidoreductase [Streptomyces sp. NPDC051940]|uniref:Gfo/Idh/MocA family protein n=1 Tax=Streptomyces sp. NPDC051940 TaxID=3155675 RepID=UPI0034341886